MLYFKALRQVFKVRRRMFLQLFEQGQRHTATQGIPERPFLTNIPDHANGPKLVFGLVYFYRKKQDEISRKSKNDLHPLLHFMAKMISFREQVALAADLSSLEIVYVVVIILSSCHCQPFPLQLRKRMQNMDLNYFEAVAVA